MGVRRRVASKHPFRKRTVSDNVFAIQEIDGNFGDRTDLHLYNGGDALVNAVAAANKNTVSG